MPCHDDQNRGERDEQRVPEPQELRFVGRQQVVIACWMLATMARRGCGSIAIPLTAAASAQVVAGAGQKPAAALAHSLPAQPPSCMFITAASVSRARLLSTTSCSTIAVRNCSRACFCRVSSSAARTDLVEDGRRALLVGRIDDVALRARRSRAFRACPFGRSRPVLMRARDDRAVGQVERRQCAATRLARSRRLSRASARQLGVDARRVRATSAIRARRRIAVVQRLDVGIRVQSRRPGTR